MSERRKSEFLVIETIHGVTNEKPYTRGKLRDACGQEFPFVVWGQEVFVTGIVSCEYSIGEYRGKPQVTEPDFYPLSTPSLVTNVCIVESRLASGNTIGRVALQDGKSAPFVVWGKDIKLELGSVHAFSFFERVDYKGEQQFKNPHITPSEVLPESFAKRCPFPVEDFIPTFFKKSSPKHEVAQAGLKAISDSPAAQKVHHAYRYGLLEHTRSMLLLAQDICSHYTAEQNLRGEPILFDVSVVAMAIIFHDVGKSIELQSKGPAIEFTEDGRLIGHIVRGAAMWDKMALEAGLDSDYSRHVSHCILSHHGKPEYGAAVVPKTPEAQIVHLIDLIDSRVGILREIAPTCEEDGWSPYTRYFDGGRIRFTNHQEWKQEEDRG